MSQDRRQRGFTIAELAAVLAVMAVLAGTASTLIRTGVSHAAASDRGEERVRKLARWADQIRSDLVGARSVEFDADHLAVTTADGDPVVWTWPHGAERTLRDGTVERFEDIRELQVETERGFARVIATLRSSGAPASFEVLAATGAHR